jgi:hypothetical protein
MDKFSKCIEVGNVLYYIINPSSKMDVPSSFYERLEKEYDKWFSLKTELSFYDYCYKQVVFTNYKIGDIVYTIANGNLIRTKVIKLYDNHIGVYSGEFIPYEKQYHEVEKNKEDLIKHLHIENLCEGANRWLDCV